MSDLLTVNQLSVHYGGIQAVRDVSFSVKEGEQTIAQLSKATGMDRAKTLYITMSLAKFGFVATGKVDDMDEYFTYKLKTK